MIVECDFFFFFFLNHYAFFSHNKCLQMCYREEHRCERLDSGNRITCHATEGTAEANTNNSQSEGGSKCNQSEPFSKLSRRPRSHLLQMQLKSCIQKKYSHHMNSKKRVRLVFNREHARDNKINTIHKSSMLTLNLSDFLPNKVLITDTQDFFYTNLVNKKNLFLRLHNSTFRLFTTVLSFN